MLTTSSFFYLLILKLIKEILRHIPHRNSISYASILYNAVYQAPYREVKVILFIMSKLVP